MRYQTDPLTSPPPKKALPEVPVERGMVLEDVETGWVGAVVGVEKAGGIWVAQLEDRHGKVRGFPLGPGFWLDGRPIIAAPPKATVDAAPRLTASGSVAAPRSRAKVARVSRIWVEGRHDAELVERIWGDDLREVAVVVEMLDGVDNLAEVLRDFQPSPTRRAGVLVDHFVPGSKETRLVDEALRGVDRSGVLVLGHPYIDVWQAIKPARLGLSEWPHVPRATDIKHGTLAALGWAHADQADIAMGWKRILGRVRDYRDLEPALLGRMEELIDFVTAVD
ncbi:MAG: DUF3097 domain-containing protein [Ruaniaceae bacterium]|nr:DUF3097 domain-containing protein [Ruaniaceae bacterium]